MTAQGINFIIPLMDNTQGLIRVYVPQPLISEMDSISKVLAYFYKQKSEDLNIIAIDYLRLIDESLEGLPRERQEAYKRNIMSFLVRCKEASSVVNEDYIPIDKKKLDNDTWEMFCGMLLFFSALLRYAGRMQVLQEMNDFYTLLGFTEWINSYKKQTQEQQGEHDTNQHLKTSQTNTQDNNATHTQKAYVVDMQEWGKD